MWNVTDDEDMGLSALSSKEKIQLLTTIQRFNEDAAISEMIKSKYDRIWPIIAKSLEQATEELLGSNRVAQISLNALAAQIKELSDAPILRVLQAMTEKLEARAKAPAPQVRPGIPLDPALAKTEAGELTEEQKAELISRRFPDRTRGGSPIGGF